MDHRVLHVVLKSNAVKVELLKVNDTSLFKYFEYRSTSQSYKW